ncbi:glycosyltransferase family protein [Anaerovibrio sp. JC8]|uniref:glycosyltransferase family protein n=1 Tax=Anaerovibrio sp. JC8 TaxID=1240085 RepID=UPI001E58839D|nr:glycosyltransferase family protein [Anaerovibrio sp. JC8]
MASAAPENKFAFITCINKEEWYQECQLYINNLEVPEGMAVELVPVRGAKSMCQGYNMGMKQTNAKYKVYLHQDTFIANRHFISDVLKIFEDKTIGALGVIGARSLPETGIWWDGLRTVGRVLHACEAESVVDSVCLDIEGPYVEVEAVDGLILVTQVDLPWREDLFTGWHFYEISQCMEMRRHGHRVVVPNQEEGFWCIHSPKEKALDPTYKQYQKIFLKEYGHELNPEI